MFWNSNQKKINQSLIDLITDQQKQIDELKKKNKILYSELFQLKDIVFKLNAYLMIKENKI